MKNIFISFVMIITLGSNLGAQESDPDIQEVLKQFITGNYSGNVALLTILNEGFQSSDIKVRMQTGRAFQTALKRRQFEISPSDFNKPEFKKLFAGLLNDEYAFMRSLGVHYLLALSAPDSQSISLSLKAIEKETDEKAMEKMIAKLAMPFNFSANQKDKDLITSMLNTQARKRQDGKLSRSALLAGKMLSSLKNKPEDILEFVVNDLYGRSIPSRSFDIIKNYGKASKKHLGVLYTIQKELNNGTYKYDRPQDKDYRNSKYIDQLISHINSL